jgi:hypothetical protein
MKEELVQATFLVLPTQKQLKLLEGSIFNHVVEFHDKPELEPPKKPCMPEGP